MDDPNAVVDEIKVDAEGKPIVDDGGVKPPEKSSLELKRESLLKAGAGEEPLVEEKPPKEEDEILFDGYFEDLLAKYPEIKNLNPKDLEEVFARYAGGLKTLQEDGEFLANLKKAGITDKATREELLAKLKAKTEITPDSKQEQPKTFKDVRREKFSAMIPAQIEDPTTGETRPITEQEKQAEMNRLESIAEIFMPSHLPDRVDSLRSQTIDLQDDLQWLLFRLEPLLEQFKDVIIPHSMRDEIVEHMGKFPLTYKEILDRAIASGENFYKPVYHHFITITKADKIEAEKKKQWEEERQKEEDKKRKAKSETTKREGEPLEEKTPDQMNLQEKRDRLIKIGKQITKW